MTLVKLTRAGTKPTGTPALRLYPTGQVAINAAAYRALDKAEHIEIYLEPGGVRLKPVPEPTEDSYRLSGFRAGGATFTSIAVVRHLVPDITESARIMAEFDGEMLAARLGAQAA